MNCITNLQKSKESGSKNPSRPFLFDISAVFRLSGTRFKGGIERVEILAVQMLLGATEGVTEATVSNKRRFCLVA